MGSSTLIALFAVVVGAYVAASVIAYVRMRGTRLVVCPETRRPAAVTVDAGHAAVGAMLHSPNIRLRSCSRWPEREDCNQACVSQIETEPRATLVSARVREWLVDKTCSKCRRPFDAWHAIGPQPGLLDPETHLATRWDDVPPGDLPVRMETHQPVCKHCQLLEDFRRQFPNDLLDRHRIHFN